MIIRRLPAISYQLSANKKAFTILELLTVILALVIILGIVVNVYLAGLTIWNNGYVRADLRRGLSQSLELISKNLRYATSIDALTASSITFTANLGGGSDTYRVYLYNASDPEPNPPYTQSLYELRYATSVTTYGSGVVIAENIIQPVNTPFAQSGNTITIDLTAESNDETVRMRSNVRPRNL